MHELPDFGGDTLFADMFAAYEGLSEPIKKMLEGMTAIHDGEYVCRGRYDGAVDEGKAYPRSEHPVLRTHPVNGRKALFVNRIFSTRLVQVSRNESDAILRMLLEHLENEAYQCRFRWQKNSVAFWDNRCAQHLAMWDYYPQRRRGLRVTIKGDAPV